MIFDTTNRFGRRQAHTGAITFIPMGPVEVLTTLHCGEGAAVAFARRIVTWQECGAIAITDLQAKWPSIEPHLKCDSYFSLASTYAQKRSVGSSVLGLPKWSRRAKCLRWINAVAVDIDQHVDKEFSEKPLLESFLEELESRNLPLPTFLAFSGRGLWALWQLKDHKNQNQPVPAFPDKQNLAQRITRALVDKLACIGADRASTDVARVMRVPGSINSKTAPENFRVQFYRVRDSGFTLPELADVLGVRACKLLLPGERRCKQGPKQIAATMRWLRPLEGFRALWKMRGGFSRGTRHFATYIYATLLRKNRATPEQVLTACIQLAESMTPQLDIADVKRAIVASQKAIHYNFSNTRLAEMLKITPSERAGLPRWFRPKAKLKSAQIAERRTLIAQELNNAPDRISTRRLAGLLAEKHGVTSSRFTVARDLRSMRGAFPLLIEPRVPLCISSKNAPFSTKPGHNDKGGQTQLKQSPRDSTKGKAS